MEFQPWYHLVVCIIYDNLYGATVSKPRSGTVLIDISVIRTNMAPPTPSFEASHTDLAAKINKYVSKKQPFKLTGNICGSGILIFH